MIAARELAHHARRQATLALELMLAAGLSVVGAVSIGTLAQADLVAIACDRGFAADAALVLGKRDVGLQPMRSRERDERASGGDE
jgi:hypothetical protein